MKFIFIFIKLVLKTFNFIVNILGIIIIIIGVILINQ